MVTGTRRSHGHRHLKQSLSQALEAVVVTGIFVAFKIRPTKTRPVTIGEENAPNEIKYNHILSRGPCLQVLMMMMS